jgi:hypothetical protein
MKREDWRRAYEPLPEALGNRVSLALSNLKEEAKPVRKFTLRTAALVLALLLALIGVAYALFDSKTADIFGWFYGDNKKEELLSGDIASVEQSYPLGDVVYTLEDVIYKDGTVYGTGRITAADGANIVLIPEDYSVNEPAGYLLHYGNEKIPEDAPSYAELAAERGAKIVLAECVANGVVNADGTANAATVGYENLPQTDGSIQFTFEFAGEPDEDGQDTNIVKADQYTLSLYLANWEVDSDGNWLRDETLQQTDWTITVSPTQKGE